MNRRAFLLATAAGGAVALAPSLAVAQAGEARAPQTLADAWALWKARHLEESGRVVDGPQERSSHSEGQGYGLTLAALMRDVDAATRIVDWTEANLAVRTDPLLAWRWFPDRTPAVPDLNNASDGDLFYAWGCLRAGRAFGRTSFVTRAQEIARALAERSVVADPRGNGRLVLLPAVDGFSTQNSVVLNPSYVMPRFMTELGSAAGVPRLGEVADDALTMLLELAQTGTTPDWILATPGGLAPSERFSDRTGYEAIRMPLFLIWSGEAGHPMVARHRAVVFASDPRPFDVATVFDRDTGEVLERSGDLGFLAVNALLACGLSPGAVPARFPGVPPFGQTQPYYPATLHLMAHVVQLGRYPTCVPI